MAIARTVFAEVLRHFEHQAVAAVRLERVQDFRKATIEGDVDDGAGDLGDAADCGLAVCHVSSPSVFG
jgi:hypothetical protein